MRHQGKQLRHRSWVFVNSFSLQNALGRIASTSDIWSGQTMQPYMGVTVHFIAKSSLNVLTLESRLVAFHGIQGSHSGENLAKEFTSVMGEVDCLNKVYDLRF